MSHSHLKPTRTINISILDNGAVAQFPEGEHKAYNFNEDNLDELQELLYDVYDILQNTRSRYDAEVLRILIAHGDKYECKSKKHCDICSKEFS